MSVVEGNDDYQVLIQIPNIKKADITINIEGNQLTISRKTSGKQTSNQGYHQQYTSRFTKSFTLPRNVNPNSMKSICKDGHLKLIFNKNTINQ